MTDPKVPRSLIPWTNRKTKETRYLCRALVLVSLIFQFNLRRLWAYLGQDPKG